MKRTPLKRGKPLKRGTSQLKRTRLKPVSKRRASQSAQRAAVNAAVRARDGQCVARLRGAPERCMGELWAHEIVKRSQRRDAHLDVENCVLLCELHNGWVEREPKMARELGLVRSNWED